MLLYKLNDGKILEKPKYSIKKKLVSTDGDDIIASSKAFVIKELCLMRDDSVYTVLMKYLPSSMIYVLYHTTCLIIYVF